MVNLIFHFPKALLKQIQIFKRLPTVVDLLVLATALVAACINIRLLKFCMKFAFKYELLFYSIHDLFIQEKMFLGLY